MTIEEVVKLAEDSQYVGTYLILSVEVRKGKRGDYLTMSLSDATGKIDAKVWGIDNQPELRKLAKDQIVLCRGRYSPYNGQPQVNVDSVSQVTDAKRGDFLPPLPRTRHDVMVLWKRLENFIYNCKRPDVICLLALATREVHDALAMGAPAAVNIHHAWMGGLMEHTVSMLGTAQGLVDHYNAHLKYPENHDEEYLDMDVITAGIIFHDLGKLQELSTDNGVIEYTPRGALLGHISMGYTYAQSCIAKVFEFDPLLADLILHVILSHHGRRDWGSPVEPITPEALLVHHVDIIDAKMTAAFMGLEEVQPDGFTNKLGAMEYRRLLDAKRYLSGGQEPKVELDTTEAGVGF